MGTSLERIKKQLANYYVVLEPDENTPQWWAGAPSIIRSKKDGIFYLAARMREGKSPRGRRGYEVRILKSNDGIKFEKIHQIHRDEVDLPVFERPSILQDPKTGKFKLFGCTNFEEGWGIWKIDDAVDPKDFDPKTLHRVLVPKSYEDEFVHVAGYKDPFIYWDYINWTWHMVVIGYDRVERPYHFTSNDGEKWEIADQSPILESNGWHNFFTRPACVIPMKIGNILIYEGSNANWIDPVYNIATGMAYTPDMKTFYDLTLDEPLLKSTTAGQYHTWRYSHWLTIPELKKIYVYFEAARPNATNEIRVSIIDYFN